MNTVTITRKQEISRSTMYNVLYILPISMFLFGMFISPASDVIKGLDIILKSNDILLTDYLYIAGTAATFVNASIVLMFNLILLRSLNLRPNGAIIAALFFLTGFSFMGKNIFNIWPFYLGGFIYSRFHNISYKNVVIINMFSTAFSPISSFIGTLMGDNILVALILIATTGAFIGFIMPTVSAKFVTFHAGYNLYNMGIAAGFVGILIYSLIEGFGIVIPPNYETLQNSDIRVLIFFSLYSIGLIVIGFLLNEKSFKGYSHLLEHSGRLITDMIKQDGFGLSLINMGIVGLISITFILVVGGVFNGPVVASFLAVIGFGAFGKHPRNIIPIIIGVVFGWIIFKIDGPNYLLIMYALFGTTLAPIAGEYGVIMGIIAGVLHSALIQNIGDMHGGLMLYSNGLSGGIIAATLVPIIDAFTKEKQ